MKKLFSLLVLLVAIVTGAWADVTVYVKAEAGANGGPFLYAWDGAGNVLNGEWPGTQMTESAVVKETTFWTKKFETSGFNIIFNTGSDKTKTPDINGITSDRYFTYNATDGTYVDVTEQYGELPDASVTSLKLAGNHANWASGAVDFTEVTAGTEYSITVDLTGQTYDDGKWLFKFIVNGGIWFGFSNVTFDGGQPTWVGQGPTDDNFEINLNNETLTSKIFTITATWGGGKYADKNWIVKIENAPAPDPENVEYFMVGSMNEWTIDNVNQLLPSKTEEGLYELQTTFAADDEFKIVSSTNVWYPGGTDNNYVVSEAGTYTISFRPEGNVEGWYEGYFNVVKNGGDDPVETRTIYLKPGIWTVDDARFAANVLDRQDPSKNSWADFEPVLDAEGYYMTEIPADASMVRMYRFDPTTTEDSANPGAFWNRTDVIVLDATNDLFKITAWPTADGGNCAHVVTSYPETYYNVNVAEGIENGEVTVDPTSAAKDDKVTVTAKPNEGYELSSITVTGVTNNEAVKVADDNTFAMIADDVTVSATFKAIPQLVGYYVVGNMTEWTYADAYQMTPDNENLYQLIKEFKTGDEIKVRSKMTEGDGAWYPSEGNNFKFTQDGEYTITFNPKGNVEGWHGGYFNVVMKEEPTPQPADTYYQKVTSTNDITDGDYLIVYEGDKDHSAVAFNGALTTLDAEGNTVAVEIKDGVIASSSAVDAAVFTVDVTNGTLKSASGYYIGVNSNSNGLKQEKTAQNYKNSFAIDGGNAVIKAEFDASTMSLRYNYGDGQLRFRYYKNAGQQAIALYKKVGGDDPQPAVINSMAIKGTFPGMENWEKEVPMTQDAANTDVWTLTMDNVTVEGKKYEYKAFANGETTGYQLPAEGNADFVFGTDMYPAGTYTLTFTANTKTHSLTLDAKKNGIETIKELNAQANGTEFSFVGNATVVAKAANGTKTYVYIKDETGSSLIFDGNGGNTANLSAGNVITAPWKGKVSIFNNLFEAVPAEVLGSTSTVEVTIPEATATDVKKENMNQVVLIKGLTIASVDDKNNIKFTIGNAAIAGYNQFAVEIPAEREGKTFDVVGSISVFKENIQFQPITITESAGPVADTWTVAGSSVTLFGTEWDTANEANDMTLTEGLYVWEKKGVELTKSVVKFKVVKNHAWDESYPADDYALNIPADGTYDVMITFNAETHEVNATTTGGPELNTYTASFENTGNWTDVYAYTFSKNEGGEVIAQELGAWPGVKLTAAEGGAYQVVIQAASAPQYIIFHNNAGVQTADLPFENGKTYGLPEEHDYTVQFVNLDGWNNVNAYAWSGNVKQLGEWPGTQMTVVDTQVQYGGQNYPVYQINFKASVAPEFIIFNNGDGMQTEDLVYVEGKQYLVLNMKGELACSMKEPMQLDYSDRIKIHNGMPKIIMGVPSETETVKINVGDAIHIRIAECPQMRSPGLQLTSNDGNTPITENLAANLHEVPAIITIPVTGALYEWMKDADHKVRLCGTNVFIDRMTVEAGAYEETATTEEEGTVSVWVPENEEGQQVAAEETIEIPATSFIAVDVKKDDIVKIKASGASAPSAKGVRARGAGRLTIIETVDIEILKKGTTDKLVADEKILISEDGSGYEFVVTEDLVNVLKTEGFDIRNKSNNPINIEAINVKAGGDVPVNYSQSINIEQLVLDNGKTYDIASALLEKYIESANINALDSLNDEKVLRNEPYLGLKLKTSGAYIKVNVEKGKTLKVKLGYVAAPVNVTVNGVDATPVEATNEGVIEEFAAADVDQEVVFTTTSEKTVVLKQIMIGEDIADVTLPPATKYEVSVAEGIENGTVTFEATSKTDSKGYVTVAVGDEVTVTATPDPGFELSGITVTGVNTDIAVIVNDGKFIMPEDAVTINAIFTTVDAIIGVKDGVRVSTVKYVKNGKLVIATPEGTFSGTGKRVK